LQNLYLCRFTAFHLISRLRRQLPHQGEAFSVQICFYISNHPEKIKNAEEVKKLNFFRIHF